MLLVFLLKYSSPLLNFSLLAYQRLKGLKVEVRSMAAASLDVLFNFSFLFNSKRSSALSIPLCRRCRGQGRRHSCSGGCAAPGHRAGPEAAIRCALSGNNCILHPARARPEHLLHVNAPHSWGGGEESSLFRAQDHTGSILNLPVFNQSIYSDVKKSMRSLSSFFQKGDHYQLLLILFLFLTFLNCFSLPEDKSALQHFQ